MKKIIISLCVLLLLAGCIESEEDKVEKYSKAFLKKINVGDASLLFNTNTDTKLFINRLRTYNICIKEKSSAIVQKEWKQYKNNMLSAYNDKKFPLKKLNDTFDKYSEKTDNLDEMISLFKEQATILKTTEYQDYYNSINDAIRYAQQHKKDEIFKNKKNYAEFYLNTMISLRDLFLMKRGIVIPIGKKFPNESRICLVQALNIKPLVEIKDVSIENNLATVTYLSDNNNISILQLERIQDKWKVIKPH